MTNIINYSFKLAFFFCLLVGYAIAQTPTILVSVAPYKFFVEQIAGETVRVALMVPAGASAHTYEPTPKEMMAASHADGWFLIGESFEARAVKAIASHHPEIQLWDLRQGVDLVSSDPHHRCTHCHCSNPNCQDLHIWLSPRQAAVQARTIAGALTQLYPKNQALYSANLDKFLLQLQQLDQDIQATLAPLQNRVILVSHPAYAYFARDYHLLQLSIEFEGKDPTPKQLTGVIQQARQHRVNTVFTQIQYNNKGARLIAEILGAKVVDLDPYAEQYFTSMREIARQFAAQQER